MNNDAAASDFLDKGKVAFSLASEAGLDLTRQLMRQPIRNRVERADQQQLQKWLIERSPQLNQLRGRLRELSRDVQQSPDDLACMAERLRRLGRIVLYLCDTRRDIERDKLIKALHYLHCVGERGRSFVSESRLKLDAGWSRATPLTPSKSPDRIDGDEVILDSQPMKSRKSLQSGEQGQRELALVAAETTAQSNGSDTQSEQIRSIHFTTQDISDVLAIHPGTVTKYAKSAGVWKEGARNKKYSLGAACTIASEGLRGGDSRLKKRCDEFLKQHGAYENLG